jgi:hypothetical protein
MKTHAGLWIDHRKAFIVFGGAEKETTALVESGLAKHPHFSGRDLAQDGSADDQLDHQFAVHLDEYYDRVIAQIGDTSAILIMGPGEARGELEKRLKHKGLDKRIVSSETADKMTDRQIVAKVGEHFKQSYVPRSLNA